MRVLDLRGIDGDSMQPRQALEEAINAGLFLARPKVPGVVVSRMRPEVRAALEGLTSADVAVSYWPLQRTAPRRGRMNR